MGKKSAVSAFDVAQNMRSDWASGLFVTKKSLADKYGVSATYLGKVLNGTKCKDIDPPKGKYEDVMLYGVKYAVYADGRIWSYTKNFFMSFAYGKYNTFYVQEIASKVRHKVRVHVLVLETFGPKRPIGCRLVRHLNDIKSDNRIENLAWGTDADNAKDAVRNGKTTYGERASTAKLTDKIVTKIRLTYNGVGSPADHCLSIVDKYGIEMSRRNAYAVCSTAWKHLNLPKCIEGVDNTGITKHERKLIMKNFKSHGSRFESKTKFAKAFASCLSEKLGRPVHPASVLSVLR